MGPLFNIIIGSVNGLNTVIIVVVLLCLCALYVLCREILGMCAEIIYFKFVNYFKGVHDVQ